MGYQEFIKINNATPSGMSWYYTKFTLVDVYSHHGSWWVESTAGR